MAKKPNVTDVRDIGGVDLEAAASGCEVTPVYSDRVFEIMLTDAIKDAGLRKVVIKEFRGHMKRLAAFKVRAEKAEKTLTKKAREESIYLLWRRGLPQKQIAEITSLPASAVNLSLKRIRAEREGHTGPPSHVYEKRPHPKYITELQALGLVVEGKRRADPTFHAVI